MRTLRPGPRPFIALGSMCALLYVLPLVVGIQTGRWIEAGKMAGALLVLPAVMLGPLLWLRIEVDDREIRVCNFGSIRKKVRFDAIGFSFPTVMVEKDWPVSLTLVGVDERTELLVIKMKVLRKEDVTWLLGLPELKIRSL